MTALRWYTLFLVLVVATFTWADYRGWAPGTRDGDDEQSADSGGHSSGSNGYWGRYQDGDIRNRTYRGGK